MDKVFFLKLALSFLVGSVWVTTVTLLAERHGSKIGGLVAGLPSTIVLGLFFIAWTQSIAVAVEATTIVPVIGGINCLFLVSYVALVRINFWLALSGSLFMWFILSLAAVMFRVNSFPFALFLYMFLLFVSLYVTEKKMGVRSEPGKKASWSLSLIVIRGFMSGIIVTIAVIMTRIGGPLLGGMFAMFPAMFLGTLLITYFSHGPSFSSAVMKASITGAISVVIYGVAVRYTYHAFGLLTGTAASILISFSSAFFIHRFMKGKLA